MKIAQAAVLICLAACGAPPSPPPPADVPVKASPLAGTVGGKPWTAGSATASARKAFEDGGYKWLDIGAKPFNCSSFVPDAEVIGVIPWQAGTAYNLTLANNLTIVTREDGGSPVNHLAFTGRVEIVSAPDAGLATVRIRAVAGQDNSIEGEIAVLVCD